MLDRYATMQLPCRYSLIVDREERVSWAIFKNTYFKGRERCKQRKGEGERKRERSPTLVLFTNACNDWGWTRQMLEVRNSVEISHVGGRNPSTPSPAACQGVLGHKLCLLGKACNPIEEQTNVHAKILTSSMNRNQIRTSYFPSDVFTCPCMMLSNYSVMSQSHFLTQSPAAKIKTKNSPQKAIITKHWTFFG